MLKSWSGTLLALFALLIGCVGEKQEEVKVFDLSLEVARIDDTVFTLADLNKQIANSGWIEHTGFKRVRDTSEFNMKAMDELIIDELLTRKARDYTIDTVLSAQTRIRDHIRMFVIQQMYNDKVVEQVKITPEDIDTFYDNNLQLFFNPPRARVAHILSTTNPAYFIEKGQSHKDIPKDSVDLLAWQKMSIVIDKLKDGEPFEELAKEYSDDQNSGKNGGLLGWLGPGETPPEFDSTMWNIPLGEVSPAVKTVHGYHLIKVYERVDSNYTPLDDALRARVEPQITAAMSERLAVSYLDSLRKTTDLTYNERLLQQPDSTYEPMDWLVVVDGVDTIHAMDYNDYVVSYKARNRIDRMTVEVKKDVLERFVPMHILDVEARKLGYYDREETVEELAEFTLLQAKHHYRLKGELGGYRPTEEEMREYYDAHVDEYYVDKPLHVQHILFEDSAKAEEIRQKIEDGADFEEMALKYYPGDEEIRKELFDLKYISEEEMPRPFWNAAWILPVGGVSRPVRTEYGFHLIKLIDRKPRTSFEHAKSDVRRTLLEEKEREVREAWRSELLGGHLIEVDSALVREFVYQADAKAREPARATDTTVTAGEPESSN